MTAKQEKLSRLQLLILLSLVAMSAISTDLYLSGLPQMVTDFTSNTSHVQLTLSLFLFGLAVGQMIAGPLSDQYGRIPILKIGLGIYTTVSAACVFAASVEVLWLLRFLQGLAAASGPVVARAIVSDLYERKDAARILSYLMSAMALIPAIAPIIGSVLLLWFDWSVHFVLLAAFGGVLWYAVAVKLPETHQANHQKTFGERLWFILSNVKNLLSDRIFIGYVICGSVAHGAMFAYISSSSYIVTELLNVPTEYFGYTFAVNCLGYMSGAYIGGKVVHRVSIRLLLGVGFGLLFVAVVTMLLQWQHLRLSVLLLAMFLVFAAGGLMLGNAQAAAITRFREIAGAASAVFGFIQLSSVAVTSMLAGYFYNDSAIPMTVIIAACAVLGALAWYVLLFRAREKH